jgi:TolB-like protein
MKYVFLEGSAGKASDQLWINLRLVDAAKGKQV